MVEISKAYEPQKVEEKWYQFWLDEGCFLGKADSAKPAYAIVIPPPNVTGVLTLGHVLNNTIQDILARKARMEGKEVLWLPGTDHAGIATQTVVEKTLKKQGLIRHRDDLGREKFLEKVQEWKDKHGGIIIQQLKRLGASCDWSRERFTMDPAYARCVQKVFVELYREGKIYRGQRLVNWDPATRTALSDEEVIMTEERGHLWHMQYPLVGGTGEALIVATTRPETMLGDEAVAVHPRDERYARYIGRQVLLPLRNRPIPVIADDLVDPKFGTGCVKVTPAHDAADYEMAVRHRLPFTVVIGPDGKMTAAAGTPFTGLDRFAAREAVLEALQAENRLVKTEDYTHNVGYSERSQVPIEPYLSEQWFLKYPEVDRSRAAVVNGDIRFHPERWTRIYTHWIDHLRDWCISRQLWWGHRIPVWYHRQTGAIHCDLDPPADAENWKQDPDVLDTWFSSWLWPFATMGWPANTDTLKKFYPTTDLVTGPDIIFFWVARMIMAGYRFMGEKPFANVYFTGIIRDKLGRKMSKSLGNSPDPLELMARYSADALRFGVMRSAPLGQDVLFDEQQVELGRNFCNKLWNAARFRQLQGGEVQGEIAPNRLTSDDRWILDRLDAALTEVNTAFEQYRFNEATQTLHRFFWSEFCDWYLETAKVVLAANDPVPKANTLAVLDFVLSHMLRLFHPFLPFISEELWHGLGYSQDMPADQGGRTILFAPWPKALGDEFRAHFQLGPEALDFVIAKYELVGLGRNLRREAGVASTKKTPFILKRTESLPAYEIEVIRLLLNASEVSVTAEYEPPKGTATVLTKLGALFLPLEGVVDVEAERSRLQKEMLKVKSEIEKVQVKLNSPAFVEKVPPAVLEEHRKRLSDWEAKKRHLETALAGLGG